MKVAIPYGAFELKRAYQANLGIALFIAGMLTFVFVTSVMFLAPVKSEKQKPKLEYPPIIDVMPQPPPTIIQPLTPEKVQWSKPKAGLLSAGIPTPVEDDLIREEKFPTQQEISDGLGGSTSESAAGYGGGSATDQTNSESIPPPDSFISYDVAPVMVTEVRPIYPELARRSGVEGRVYVQAWVDKRGKVTVAQCLKQGSINLDIFCESALEAARQNQYRPAIANKVPIPCWVMYKVDFVLR